MPLWLIVKALRLGLDLGAGVVGAVMIARRGWK